MDLANSYHTFIRDLYPDAIRIADRFHVNRYVTDTLHGVRRDVQKSVIITNFDLLTLQLKDGIIKLKHSNVAITSLETRPTTNNEF